MKLTHTRDNRLAALLVRADGERRILLGQLGKTVVELGDVCLALRLHGDRKHRVREAHRLQHDRMLLRAEGITRADILEAHTSADVTSVDRLHGDLLVGVHLEEAADTLLFARARVIDIRTSLDLTGINAEEHQTTHERIGSDLEGQSCSRLILARLAILFLLSIGVRAHDSLRVERRGKEGANIVEQRLDALVLVRRTEQHRRALHRDTTLADSSDDHLLGNILTIKVELHQLIVKA